MCTSTGNLSFCSERCPGVDDFTTAEGDPDIEILLTTPVKVVTLPKTHPTTREMAMRAIESRERVEGVGEDEGGDVARARSGDGKCACEVVVRK